MATEGTPAFAAASRTCSAPAPAERVVLAGCGFDGHATLAQPMAVGIVGDRIAWVAPTDALGTPACPMTADAEVDDHGDAFLMPGFHDAHLHFFHSALYRSPLASRFVGASEADCVDRLRAFAATRPREGWLLAQGWREYLWDDPRLPTKASLDAAFPDRPVALYSGDAHTLWLNSTALAQLGIGPESRAPAGGSYDRDDSGELTGLVREAAAMALMPRIMEGFPTSDLLEAYRAFQRHLGSQGITAVCDLALTALPGLDFVRDDLFCQLEAAGQLTVRTHLFPTLTAGDERLAALQDRLNGPMLRACGYKQFFDGVSSQHTAWLREPYANARFKGDCGRPTVEPQAMEALVAEATARGQGVRIHAIGDEAIHEALRIYGQMRKAAQPQSGKDPVEPGGLVPDEALMPLLTLEHLEGFQPGDIARLAPLGVVASVQPQHMTLDPGGPERDLGPERLPYMWPLRSLLDDGATLAFGTDSPVTGTSPLKGIYAAVTRRDADTRLPEDGWLPEQAITTAEALRAYTAGSAAACGRSHELGLLAPGMLADLAVLDRNLLAASPDELLEARVIATYVGGRPVWLA